MGTGPKYSEENPLASERLYALRNFKVHKQSIPTHSLCHAYINLAGIALSLNVSQEQDGNLPFSVLLSDFHITECSSPAPGPGKEWEEYTQIRSLVEKIRKKQKGTIVGWCYWVVSEWSSLSSLCLSRERWRRHPKRPPRDCCSLESERHKCWAIGGNVCAWELRWHNFHSFLFYDMFESCFNSVSFDMLSGVDLISILPSVYDWLYPILFLWDRVLLCSPG